MAFGDYDGPNKPDKGKEGGSCNRSRCQAPNAIWFNHGSLSWYCTDCRFDIEFDVFNHRNWQLNHKPKCGHPMFETREMMDARASKQESPSPGAGVRIRITEEMIDASFDAMKEEALKDGHDWSVVEEADPEATARFREVVRAMLQAAANTLST